MRPNKRGTLPAGDASSAYRYIDADRSLHCILLQKKKTQKFPKTKLISVFMFLSRRALLTQISFSPY